MNFQTLCLLYLQHSINKSSHTPTSIIQQALSQSPKHRDIPSFLT